MNLTTAIARRPSPNFADGLTTAELGAPDYELMCRQHRDYTATLEKLGLTVSVLEPLPGFPDGHFVEDVAVVTPALAVITRPGAPSRRGETAAMMPVLNGYKPLACIEAPGLLEGGDVAVAGQHIFIGLSERTNEAGAEQLGRLLEPQGYSWSLVPVGEGLHLKSSVNYLGEGILLLTADFAGRPDFSAYRQIVVETAERYAANSLLVNDTILMPKGFPRLRKKLDQLGRSIIELDMSESEKMDGGLTCLSIRF